MRKALLRFCFGATLFAAAFAAAALVRSGAGRQAVLSLPSGGSEWALVLIVSPTCAACLDAGLPDSWARVVQRARAGLTDSVPDLSIIGVALSATPEEGARFLRRFGPFHEISTGRGIFNLGAVRYLTSDFRGPPAVPQVVVLRRDFARRSDGSTHLAFEEVVQRFDGLEAIRIAETSVLQGATTSTDGAWP